MATTDMTSIELRAATGARRRRVLYYAFGMSALLLAALIRWRGTEPMVIPFLLGLECAAALIVMLDVRLCLRDSGRSAYGLCQAAIMLACFNVPTVLTLTLPVGIGDVAHIAFALAAMTMLVTGLTVLASGFIAWRLWGVSTDPNDCRSCGYNLTGNESGCCPECGTVIGTMECAND